MAVCFQKMGSLEECSIALENSLVYLSSYNSLSNQSIARRMMLMQQEARIRIQLCALFSQLHQHIDALEQAKMSTKLLHRLIKDLLALCDFYTKKKFIKEKAMVYDESILYGGKNAKHKPLDASDSQNRLIVENLFETDEEDRELITHNPKHTEVHNYLEEDLSLIERTAQRVKPIIEAVCKLLVKEKQIDSCDLVDQENEPEIPEKSYNEENKIEDGKLNKPNKVVNKKIEPDMRIVLGYLNQLELISTLNIGNLMQIVPVKIEELLSVPRNETEFNRESFICKIALLCVAYFCISTEIRFIIQLKEDPNYNEKSKNEESEYWHAKSLEIACTFLPSDCPLLNHILLSYQKHHSPSQQTIQEDSENDQNLYIVKPLKGIESCKFMPIVRKIDSENIVITPSSFSPADTITNQMILSYQNFCNYGVNSGLQMNDKSSILDYSSSKYKGRNTGTTRHRSSSPNANREDNESFNAGNLKAKINKEIPEKDDLNQNSFASAASMSKKNSSKATSERQIIDKLLNFIMKDKNIKDKERLLEALTSEEFDLDQFIRPSGKQRCEKDSLFIDSVLHNHHSTSYKDIHNEDSLNHGLQAAELHKFSMMEELVKNDKKKDKDKKFIEKLVDRSSTSQKKMRPKSSKGLRGNHVKVNTMGYISHSGKQVKGTKVTGNTSSNIQGNQLRKQGKAKKYNQNYAQHTHGLVDGIRYTDNGLNFGRPNSSNDCRDIKSFNSIKTPKENNREKIAGVNIFESSKLNESKSYLMDNNTNLLQNCFQPSKPFQSRNISTNLTYVKSQGSNLEGFSFFKPSSAKGDIHVDKQQRKQKSK